MSETPQSGLNDNTAGALAYVTFIPAIIFLLMAPYNTNSYIRFHSFQSILLNVAAFVIGVAIAIFTGIIYAFLPWGFYGILHGVSLLIDLLWFILWLVCVMRALNGVKFKIPLLGNFAEQMANK